MGLALLLADRFFSRLQRLLAGGPVCPQRFDGGLQLSQRLLQLTLFGGGFL